MSKNEKQLKSSLNVSCKQQNPEVSAEELEQLMENQNSPTLHRPRAFQEHDVHLIDVGLYLGNREAAQDLEFLRTNGFTHVLNAAQGNGLCQVNTNADYYKSAKIKYLGIPAVDLPDYNILKHFEKTSRFIDDALKHGGKILVHCLAGVSRSATLVIAYLMKCRRMSASEAVLYVNNKRMILPNHGFLEQLAVLNSALNI